ncbi:MAG: thiamine-phosphate kinase [Bacillota bacterium]
MKTTPLGDVGEFGLIDRLVRAWEGARGRGGPLLTASGPDGGRPDWGNLVKSCLRLGIGDDAAAIDLPAGKTLLTTADMLVEGVHFLWDFSRARVLGRKALAANISDIAAMGGVPGWVFLSIGAPPRAAVEEAEELYAGMGEMAARFGVVLAGGDTVRSEKWVISVALLGITSRSPISRGGGRAGDLIMVTGTVGDSAAGLQALLNPGAGRAAGLHEETEYLLSRHLDPVPRVEEARALAGHGGVTAMIDVSDGVASEVHHICRNSGCGAWLDLASLPVSRQAKKLAPVIGQEATHWALYGGEDYELLFTASPDTAPSLIKHIQEVTGTPVTVIGVLTGAEGGVLAVEPDELGGRTIPLPQKGYNHFT